VHGPIPPPVCEVQIPLLLVSPFFSCALTGLLTTFFGGAGASCFAMTSLIPASASRPPSAIDETYGHIRLPLHAGRQNYGQGRQRRQWNGPDPGHNRMPFR